MKILSLFLVASQKPGEGLIIGGLIGLLTFAVITISKSLNNKKNIYITKNKLKSSPYDIAALVKLIESLIESNNYDEAISNLEKIIRIDSENVYAIFYLAIIYHKQKRYNDSRIYLNKIVNELVITTESRMNLIKQMKFYNINLLELGELLNRVNYYYGHLKYLDGDIKKALELKNGCIDIDSSFAKENLY